MGFVVAIESAPKPRAYFSLRALAYYLGRAVRLDRQVSQLRLVGMLSAQRFTTRFVQARCCRIFYSHFKSSRPGNLVRRSSVKHYLLSIPPACLAPLECRLFANYLLASLLILLLMVVKSLKSYLYYFFLKLRGLLVFVPNLYISTIFLCRLTCLHIPCCLVTCLISPSCHAIT